MKEKNLKIIDELLNKLCKLNEHQESIDKIHHLIEKNKFLLLKKGKFLIAFLLALILTPFALKDTESSLYSFFAIIFMIIVIIFPLFFAEKTINIVREKKKDQEIAKLNLEIIERSLLLAENIYESKYIPARLIHPEYLKYIRECIGFNKTDTIGKAIVLLENEIRHQETLGVLTKISLINEEIYKQLLDTNKVLSNINSSLLSQVELIKKIQANNSRKSSLTDLVSLATAVISNI